MKMISRTLGDICDEVNGIIRTGPFGSQLHESDYTEHGIPVVMPKNIVDGKVSVFDIAYIGEVDADRLAQHKLSNGDIVYGRRGDIGRRALISKKERGYLCGTGCLRISLGDRVLNPVFLYYYLGQPNVVQWVANQAVGSTLPNLNTSIIRNIKISYPPLITQHKIASILSAYDDLIENNTRRIAILEEMAQSLYQEWFVHYRFPGYEKNKMVESELGLIPDGWKVVTVGNIAKEVRRSVNPATIDPETPYIGLEHLPRKSIALIQWGTAKDIQSTKLVFKQGEILFGKIRPYFHKVGIAPLDGVCSSDTIVIVPISDKYFSLLLCCVSSVDFVDYATSTSQGTKMPRANWDVLTGYSIVLPSINVLADFNDQVRTIVSQIHNLIFRTRNLRHTRDLLLPKLISGEIDVEYLTASSVEAMVEIDQEHLMTAANQ
jgi:type I restriction enzyme S subunit